MLRSRPWSESLIDAHGPQDAPLLFHNVRLHVVRSCLGHVAHDVACLAPHALRIAPHPLNASHGTSTTSTLELYYSEFYY